MTNKKPVWTPEQVEALAQLRDQVKTLEGRVLGLCLRAMDDPGQAGLVLAWLERGAENLAWLAAYDAGEALAKEEP